MHDTFTPRTQGRYLSTMSSESMVKNVIIPSLQGREPDYMRLVSPMGTPLLRMSLTNSSKFRELSKRVVRDIDICLADLVTASV